MTLNTSQIQVRLHLNSHFVSVVQEGVGDDSGIGGKEPEVDGNVTSRHVSGTVGLVHFLVEDTPVIGDVKDVVGFTESIKGSVPFRVVSK